MDSPPLASRHFISTPLPRQHVLSFKLRGGGGTAIHMCTTAHSYLCSGHGTVCWPCTGPEHFAVKSWNLSVPDCGWWGSSQEYTAFCIQPARSTWLLWHWGSCKFAWLHIRITLDTVRWVRGIWRLACPFSGSILWPLFWISKTPQAVDTVQHNIVITYIMLPSGDGLQLIHNSMLAYSFLRSPSELKSQIYE